MKPKQFNLILFFSGLLLTLSQQAIIIANPVNPVSCENVPTPSEKSVQCIQDIAKQVTVKISGKVKESNISGSGVIIAQEKIPNDNKTNYLYLVLTNRHVIESLDSIKVETFDQTIHQAFLLKNANQKLTNAKLDLALIWFASPESYNVATLNDVPINNTVNSDEKKADQVQSVKINKDYEKMYVSGFPCQETVEQSEKKCQFELNPTLGIWWDSPLNEGYQIGYPIDAISGISGGSVLNNQGKLIGIHGKGNLLQQATFGYRYETLPKLSDESKRFMNYFSIAIPILRYQTLFPKSSYSTLFQEAQNYYDNQNPQPATQTPLEQDHSWFNRVKKALNYQNVIIILCIFLFLYFNLIFIYFNVRLNQLFKTIDKGKNHGKS